MGRKSLSEERTGQILNAFATCILTYGLHDSSLERIAAEAGVKRSIIRHYIGNRDEVLKALVDRITGRYIRELVAATENMPPQSFNTALLGYFFPEKTAEEDKDDLVIQSLLLTGEQDTLTRRLLLRMYEKLEEILTAELNRVYPNSGKENVQNLSYSIVCLSFGNASLIWLGLSDSYNSAACECARGLLHTLEK